MNTKNKIGIIIFAIIGITALIIMSSAFVNIINKEYILGSFYTLETLITIIVISGLIVLSSLIFIINQFKRRQ